MRQDKKNIKKSTKKKSKAPIVILLILVLIGAGVAGLYFTHTFPFAEKEAVDTRPINPLTGLRVDSLPNRVVQVSIDNVDCIPQSGLSKADIIYEFPAEGGLTRLQAIFYSETPDVVGPIRSARPYFIDLAREYSAVFVHHGGSQAAFEYLDTGVVDDISPNTNASIFWRSDQRIAPHNSMINYSDLWDVIKSRSMDKETDTRTFTFAPETTDEDSTQSTDEETTPSVTAITVDNPYTLVKYKYNEDTKLYDRYVDGELYVDAENDESITQSNIIIQYVKSKVLDSHGRLSIDMTAGGKALLFTGGEVVKGTWSREDLDSPTVFTDSEGNDFVLSRGKTWIHVIDQNAKVTYN
jgi:hypothetical protein